jgi:hypothetical protein
LLTNPQSAGLRHLRRALRAVRDVLDRPGFLCESIFDNQSKIWTASSETHSAFSSGHVPGGLLQERRPAVRIECIAFQMLP